MKIETSFLSIVCLTCWPGRSVISSESHINIKIPSQRVGFTERQHKNNKLKIHLKKKVVEVSIVIGSRQDSNAALGGQVSVLFF